jgi:hypothetical protein
MVKVMWAAPRGSRLAIAAWAQAVGARQLTNAARAGQSTGGHEDHAAPPLRENAMAGRSEIPVSDFARNMTRREIAYQKATPYWQNSLSIGNADLGGAVFGGGAESGGVIGVTLSKVDIWDERYDRMGQRYHKLSELRRLVAENKDTEEGRKFLHNLEPYGMVAPYDWSAEGNPYLARSALAQGSRHAPHRPCRRAGGVSSPGCRPIGARGRGGRNRRAMLGTSPAVHPCRWPAMPLAICGCPMAPRVTAAEESGARVQGPFPS